MQAASPLIVVVAGPNGASKSTTAPHLLRDAFAVSEFVNADTIAQGLSAFRPESVAIAAGRVMLERLQMLPVTRESFAFETTLASRHMPAVESWRWFDNSDVAGPQLIAEGKLKEAPAIQDEESWQRLREMTP